MLEDGYATSTVCLEALRDVERRSSYSPVVLGCWWFLVACTHEGGAVKKLWSGLMFIHSWLYWNKRQCRRFSLRPPSSSSGLAGLVY